MPDDGAARAAGLLNAEAAPLSNIHSWQQCYAYFGRKTQFDQDRAALMLGFYLASWGMFRGSSQLRNFSYVALMPIVTLVRSDKWTGLRGISLAEASKKAADIFDLLTAIQICLENKLPKVAPTATLLSKIALGTLACIPAYDRFFIGGAIHRSWPEKFSADAFTALLDRARRDDKFETFCNVVESSELRLADGEPFPEMRLLDAYVNHLGAELGARVKKAAKAK
jgi:hypothetical protein